MVGNFVTCLLTVTHSLPESGLGLEQVTGWFPLPPPRTGGSRVRPHLSTAVCACFNLSEGCEGQGQGPFCSVQLRIQRDKAVGAKLISYQKTANPTDTWGRGYRRDVQDHLGPEKLQWDSWKLSFKGCYRPQDGRGINQLIMGRKASGKGTNEIMAKISEKN